MTNNTFTRTNWTNALKKGGRAMQNEKNYQKQLTVKLITLGVLSLICVGSVHSWNVHEVSQRNTLKSHTTQISIAENFEGNPLVSAGDTVLKEVLFRNEGSSPVFLRMAYIESLEQVSGDGEWLANDPGDTNVTKNWTNEWANDWVHIDGWYYYKKVLPAGGATDLIMESVSFAADLDPKYADANYEIDFIVEAVQLSDEDAVNTNATKIVFGKTATVTNAAFKNGAVISGTVTWK